MRVLIMALLFLTACKPEAPVHNYTATPPLPTDADRGDSLEMVIASNPSTLNPLLAGESVGVEIAGSIYNSLLTYDANLNLKGELAERWDITDGGRTITFTLRNGVTFSDGTPLTSADVLASFNAITNPTTQTPYAGDYLMVTHASTPTPHTFRVTYATPFVPALASWASLSILPKHVLDKTASVNDSPLNQNPLGSGPYQLAHWNNGRDILLTANPRSWQKPFIRQYHYRIIPDPDTEFMELKAGNVDIAGLKPLAYNRLTDGDWFTQNYRKIRYLANAYTFMGFNLKRPLFQDKRVRQALSHALDRQGIINAVLFGQGLPMAGIFKPGTWAYNEKLEPYAYNPAQARELLDQAGWRDTDGDGIRDKNGVPLAFTVVTNQGNDARIKTAEIMQSFFRDVGVKLDIRVQEWSTFITNTIHQRDFDAILLGWGLGAEPDPYDIWHSSKTKPDEFNMIGYANPRADDLMTRARYEFNQTKRKKLLDELQVILHNDQPYLWLYAPYALLAVHKRIQNVIPAPAGITYNRPEWWVPKEWWIRNRVEP